MAQLQGLTVNDTGNLTLPSGTIAQRPSSTVSVQSFTSVGTTSWTAPTGITSVEVLVVAGGGSGATGNGDRGGGGAGGLIYYSSYPVTPGTSYTVTVGAGGAVSAGQGNNGNNSVFDKLIAIGGGGGGNFQSNGNSGGSGGGGGGGSPALFRDATGGGYGGLGTVNQGNPGGIGGSNGGSSGRNNGGGGGGAGSGGQDCNSWGNNFTGNAGGSGGAGLAFSITGTPAFYAGGGAGGSNSGYGGNGGIGGGGLGISNAGNNGLPGSPAVDVNGAPNTGGGGGAGPTGGSGGSGIVVLRYSQDASGNLGQGRVRYNTSIEQLESFASANRWNYKNTSNNGITAGLVLDLDASTYTTGSTWYDSSPFGRHATMFNNPTYDPEVGGNIIFNGTNQYADVSATLGGSGEWTMHSWFKVNGAPSNATHDNWIIDTDGTGSSANGIVARWPASNFVGYRSRPSSGGGYTDLNGPPLQTGRWNCVTVVRRGLRDTTLYLNGKQVNRYTGSVPTNTQPTTRIARWTDGITYANVSIARVQFFNRALSVTEVSNHYEAQKLRFSTPTSGKILGSNSNNAARSAAEIYANNPDSPNGVYWIRPNGRDDAYPVFCRFNYLNNHWFAVSGMSSSGVRGDANGRASGLAGLNLFGENVDYATLGNNSEGNSRNFNFTLPRNWINATRPIGLRVQSVTQNMTALFDKTGTYRSCEDIWSYYWAINNYDDIPHQNGRNVSGGTVGSWVGTNVNIYQGTTFSNSTTIVWTGNEHCGWSTGNSYHMLHGSTNYSYPGPYPGFCLDGTCWNESGIVYLAGT